MGWKVTLVVFCDSGIEPTSAILDTANGKSRAVLGADQMLLMMFCNSDQKQKINILKWTLCLSVDPPCSKMLSLGGENPAKMQTSCVNPLV